MNNWDPPRIVVDANQVAEPNGRSGRQRRWRRAGVPSWVWVTTGVLAMIGVGTITTGGDQPEIARIVSISATTDVAQSPLPVPATAVAPSTTMLSASDSAAAASTAPSATTVAPETTAPPSTVAPTTPATTAPPTTVPPTTVPPTTTVPASTAPPPTTTRPPPESTIAVQPVLPQDRCDPNYSGCVPIDTDVDCAGGSGNGPSYVAGPVTVIGDDIYGLDRDNDGIGCE